MVVGPHAVVTEILALVGDFDEIFEITALLRQLASELCLRQLESQIPPFLSYRLRSLLLPPKVLLSKRSLSVKVPAFRCIDGEDAFPHCVICSTHCLDEAFAVRPKTNICPYISAVVVREPLVKHKFSLVYDGYSSRSKCLRIAQF